MYMTSSTFDLAAVKVCHLAPENLSPSAEQTGFAFGKLINLHLYM